MIFGLARRRNRPGDGRWRFANGTGGGILRPLSGFMAIRPGRPASGRSRRRPEGRSAMLNIAFFDAMRWDYDVSTPHERPLGGSQSALSYLSVELARRGSRVTLYCGTSRPREVL